MMARTMLKLLRQSFAAFLFSLALFTTPSKGQTGAEHWVVTWTAASRPYTEPFVAYQPVPPPFVDVMRKGILDNQTIRMMVHSTIGGRRVRIRLSNLFGKEPLRVGAAHIGLFPLDLEEPFWGSTVPRTDRTLLFAGSPSVTIPAGQAMFSDPADLAIPPMASVGVTLYLPERTPSATVQFAGRLAAAITANADFSPPPMQGIRFGPLSWLSSVDVLTASDAGAIVVLSDVSDGIVSEPAWPMRLARRLISNPGTEHMSVVTQADGDSRYSMVDTGRGISALDRLERDVLSQSGIEWIVLAPLIHELEASSRPINPILKGSVEDLVRAFQQIVQKAHAKGVKVIGCTVPPRSLTYGEDKRQAINSWIRTAGLFDALIDLDRITRDPEHPEQPAMAYVAGRPHPEVADAIDLSMFTRSRQ